MKKSYCFFIDDDHDEQAFFVHAANSVLPNLKIILFDSGEEALTFFTKEEAYAPEFLFIDMNLPRINGLELLHGIWKQIDLSLTKVIIYSTGIIPSHRVDFASLNVFEIVDKPVTLDEMHTLLTRLLN